MSTSTAALKVVVTEIDLALAQARLRLAQLTAELARHEREWTERKRDLDTFEQAYLRRVGRLVDEVYRLRQQIRLTERRLRLLEAGIELPDPDDPTLHPGQDEFPDDEALADRLRETDEFGRFVVSRRRRTGAQGRELLRLFRLLARRFHPDMAVDAVDHARRQDFMQRINDAFRAADLAQLRAIEQESHQSDRAAVGPDRAVQRLRQLHQELTLIRTLVAERRQALQQLSQRSIYALWTRHCAGEAVLENLELDLERTLQREGARLDDLIATLQRRASPETESTLVTAAH